MPSKKKKLIYSILFFSIFLHIIFINFSPVNFEFIFFEAADFIEKNFKKEIAARFFNTQANTFFFSLILSFFFFIFPFIKPIYIGKLISLSSYLFITLGGINFYNKKNFNNINYFLIFLFINPLIWILGYRSTPDIISMALAFYGLSIIYKYQISNKHLYSAAIIIGFATTLKPITGIYLIAGLILFKFKYFKINFIKYLIIGSFFSIIPLIYFFIIYLNFNFFLFSPYYKSVLSPVTNPILYISNIIQYSSFLLIFTSPILIGSIILNIKNSSIKSKTLNLIIFIITFYLGSKYLKTSAEMNFGIISSYLNQNILNGLLCFIAYIFLLLLFFEIKKNYLSKDFIKTKFFFIIVVYLLIISFSLPSQRYLIVILPLFYYVLIPRIKYGLSFNVLFLFIFCIPVNILLMGNHYITGSVSNKMVEYIKKNNLTQKVCPSAIESHVGNNFPTSVRDPIICSRKTLHIVNNYGVILVNDIYSISENFLFLKKELSLRKIR